MTGLITVYRTMMHEVGKNHKVIRLEWSMAGARPGRGQRIRISFLVRICFSASRREK